MAWALLLGNTSGLTIMKYIEHFLSSNIPSSPAYGVFISQLIRYARACSSYEIHKAQFIQCFIPRAVRLSNKLLGQGYIKEGLK